MPLSVLRGAGRWAWCGLALLFAVLPAVAQTPAASVMGPTQAATIPASGRQPGAEVSVTQQTNPGASSGSVDVLNSTLTIQGSYGGSGANEQIKPGTVLLRLEDALKLGLRNNLGALVESASLLQAEGQRTVAKSQLLPTLNAGIAESFQQTNLRTLGVSIDLIPERVKFNYYDARVRLTQSVVDLVRTHNLRAATENRDATLGMTRDARDLVVLAVGGSYLQLISTRARLDATAVNVDVERTIYRQAADRLAAGLSTRLDANRAQVQLQTEQQRLRSVQADLETQKLKFARLVGLAPAQQFVVLDQYPYAAQTSFTQEAALQRAATDRNDLRAATSGVKAAEAAVKAAHAERLPNLAVDASFGAAGTTPTNHSIGVFSVSGLLTVPLFEGGRIRGEEQQAAASLKQRKAEYADTLGQVDADVRQAFIQLNAAADQVQLTQSNTQLAHESLRQSQDRFIAGITDTVEVVQAEQAVAQADDDYIAAVFEHNLAKLSLARAMGNAEQTLPQLLRKP